jgi:hypothetical protein
LAGWLIGWLGDWLVGSVQNLFYFVPITLVLCVSQLLLPPPFLLFLSTVRPSIKKYHQYTKAHSSSAPCQHQQQLKKPTVV